MVETGTDWLDDETCSSGKWRLAWWRLVQIGRVETGTDWLEDKTVST